MWHSFFVSAGIPANVASKYAHSFEENRITKAMLGDLDKATLSELGVRAVGDQIAILHRIKDGPSATASTPATSLKIRLPITGPLGSSSSSSSPGIIPTASEARKGRPPPDSHEIYHIKMPSGATRKTQQILHRAEQLRSAGLLKRAHSGVRQGGRPVSPISKDPTARRLALHNRRMQQEEVSSSTDYLTEQLGIKGMYSDRGSGGVQTGRIMKKTIHPEEKLLTRALHSAVTSLETEEGPRIRVRLPLTAPTFNKPKVTVAPKTVVKVGGAGVRLIGQERQKPKIVRPVITTNKKTSLQGRIQFKGATKPKITRPHVKIVYQDDGMADDGGAGGDSFGYVDQEWDQMQDDEDLLETEEDVDFIEGQEEIVEDELYEDNPKSTRGSIFDRIRI